MIQDPLSALAVLFEENQEWARVIARNVHRKLPPSFDIEDLEQVAVIAMWKLCEKYNPANAKGTPFQAFAYLGTRGAVLMHCRRRSWKEATNEPLDDAMVSAQPDPEERLELQREDRLEGQRLSLELGKVTVAIDGLPAINAYLVTRHFLDGMEIEELALQTGMDHREVGRRLSSAVRQLKKAVGG